MPDFGDAAWWLLTHLASLAYDCAQVAWFFLKPLLHWISA